ncbi:MAG TPA: dihydroorotate dehydrogenase [Spirochaetia bacterium]|nr:dihydroorotate dehydrogenase [Spirochaetia bacterium]
MDLSVTIKDCTIKNPVGLASGTSGYGSEYESLIPMDVVGCIYTKALTLTPRPGNDTPRIVETPSGLLNSIGLANVGVDAFLKEKAPFLRRIKGTTAAFANVAGSTPEEYAAVIEKLENADFLAGYEVNLSCPNVQHGCMAFGTDPNNVESLVSRLRKLTPKPIIVKLTPNVTDITVIARAAEAGGADAVSCINTLVGMVIDTEKMRPVFAAGTGGLSGPAIRPVGVAAVYRVSHAIRIPVIGIGGILEWNDAVQYLLAGASAVQMGTGIFVDPDSPRKVLSGIAEYAKKAGFSRISDFHGHF